MMSPVGIQTNLTFPSGSQMFAPWTDPCWAWIFYFKSQVLAPSLSVALENSRRVATGNRLFLILPCYLELISHMLLLFNSLHEFSQIFLTYVISIYADFKLWMPSSNRFRRGKNPSLILSSRTRSPGHQISFR